MVYINYVQAILVRVIHSETNILINFDTLNSIQFEPKWNNQQLIFSFHCYAFFKYCLTIARNCIVQVFQRKMGNTAIIVTSDWFFLHFYWWFNFYLNLVLFSICRCYFEWIWYIRNAYMLALSFEGMKAINNY